MAYLDFEDFPDLIKYYTTIGNSTLLNEEYTTTHNCILLNDLDDLTYLTKLNFLEYTPNQIIQLLSILILCQKISTLLLVNFLPYMISWPSHEMN